MRSTNHAWLFGLVLVLVGGCRDDQPPDLVVQTTVPRPTVAAGERVGARCAVLDATGQPALDARGNPLGDSVEFVITYRHEDAFATDAEGKVIATRAGAATVRCAAPALALVDPEPASLAIVAGPAARVVTELASPVAAAGEPVGVSCLAFDAYGNPVTAFSHELTVSPSGAGVAATGDAVSATAAGEYDVSCMVTGAADVAADALVVVPALPSSLAVSVDPERSLYGVDEQVALVADARDRFGNRVDDVALVYTAAPAAPSPSEAAFRFPADGAYTLSARVTSPTDQGAPLAASRTVFVNSAGPAIQCMRADAPDQPSEAYMLQREPSTLIVPVRVTGAFDVASVTINGTPATLDPATGTYQAPVAAGFGMTFVDVVARDQLGRENSTTCFVLAAAGFAPETGHLPGALAMRLDPAAISDPRPGGLDSLNDILGTVLSSAELRGLVDGGLIAANPINGGSCGVFACSPRVTYNAGTIRWDTPVSSLVLVPGGLLAQVTLPSVRLDVRACGTTCCIGGSTIGVTASSIRATVQFNLQLAAGVLRATVAGSPSVTVDGVALDGSGFCGVIVDLLERFFTGTVRDAIRGALASFVTTSVAPLLDQLMSSLDVNTLGASFAVPRLDGTSSVELQFGLAFSSFDITASRVLVGIGTRFAPASVGHGRPSLGIPQRTQASLLDPPGTSDAAPVGVALYEGVLNQVLHGLWRAGFFQATLQIARGAATIDARLPPVAAITGSEAQLMLGGIDATIRLPGIIDTPIAILFGGRARASLSLTGDALRFGDLALSQLFVAFRAPLTQRQREAMAGFLTQILQRVLADAINAGLPAFPIPTFALPDSAGPFGLPPGAQLGVIAPRLSTSGTHVILDGSFGVRN